MLLRSTAVTTWPRSTSPIVIAKPMPLAAPVTITELFAIHDLRLCHCGVTAADRAAACIPCGLSDVRTGRTCQVLWRNPNSVSYNRSVPEKERTARCDERHSADCSV